MKTILAMTTMLLCLAPLTACNKKNGGGATPPAATSTAASETTSTESVPEETARETSTSSTSADDSSTDTSSSDKPGQRFLLLDSGIRCVTTPCPSWTARPESGDDIQITHVDLAPLGLSKPDQAALRQKLTQGWWVTAEILEGPKERTGTGTTIRIYQVHEAATK